MSDVGECRSCKAPVIWTLTPAGAKAPIDVDPSAGGNVLLLRQSRLGVISAVLSGDALELARRGGVQLRLNHWASCPQKAEWRAAQAAKAAARAASHESGGGDG